MEDLAGTDSIAASPASMYEGSSSLDSLSSSTACETYSKIVVLFKFEVYEKQAFDGIKDYGF